MGRKLKYGSETVVFTKRVPKDKVEEINEVIDELLHPKSSVEIIEVDESEFSENIAWLSDEILNKMKLIRQETMNALNGCACIVVNNILFKDKTCKLTKAEHKF